MDICVGRYSSCTYQERHDEKPNVAKQLHWWIFTSWFGAYCIYAAFLDLMQVPRIPLKVAIVLLVCLTSRIFKVNNPNIECFWIFLDIQSMQDPLCTAVLTITFSWSLLPEMWFIFQFCWFNFVTKSICSF